MALAALVAAPRLPHQLVAVGPMTYPFVQSYHDAGLRRGPIRGFCVHMAEGGGTVGYLARPNANGVSVHYVIEYTGRTVQMLRESHMHTSIRIRNADGSSAIRQATGTDGFGVANARAVLGDWYDVKTTLGPNHSTVAVEVEGFAANGPNPAQIAALVKLAADVRARNAGTIRGNTGHRDHNVKACPGQLIPWAALGGHGLYATTPDPAPAPPQPQEPEMALTFFQPTSGTITTPPEGCLAEIVSKGFNGPFGGNETYTTHGTCEIVGKPGRFWLSIVGGTGPDPYADPEGYLVAFRDEDVGASHRPLPAPAPGDAHLTSTTAPDGKSVLVAIAGG